MNITKKQWMIIGVVVALIAIWYFFLRKKSTESGYSVGRGYVPDQNLLLYKGRPLVGGGESSFNPALPLIGGNRTRFSPAPVGRVKPWGGRVESGRKMCFDTAQEKYVDCGLAPSKN